MDRKYLIPVALLVLVVSGAVGVNAMNTENISEGKLQWMQENKAHMQEQMMNGNGKPVVPGPLGPRPMGPKTGNCEGNSEKCVQVEEKMQEKMELTEEQIETLKASMEDSYESTEEIMENSEGESNKFLLWSHGGEHIAVGYYENGFFIATDLDGVKIWGVYSNGIFAGFYGDDFFYGRYWRGRWGAWNIFGEEFEWGRYVLFPNADIELAVPLAIE